MMHSRHENTDG